MTFYSKKVKDDIDLKEQEINSSGVRIHHQNEVLERAIQSITSWAMTTMLH